MHLVKLLINSGLKANESANMSNITWKLHTYARSWIDFYEDRNCFLKGNQGLAWIHGLLTQISHSPKQCFSPVGFDLSLLSIHVFAKGLQFMSQSTVIWSIDHMLADHRTYFSFHKSISCQQEKDSVHGKIITTWYVERGSIKALNYEHLAHTCLHIQSYREGHQTSSVLHKHWYQQTSEQHILKCLLKNVATRLTFLHPCLNLCYVTHIILMFI